MKVTINEIYYDVEKAIDFAFSGKFVLKFYDYLKINDYKKVDIENFIQSSTFFNIEEIIYSLDEYIKGGSDNYHKQLREAYGHISKPEARKIKKYLLDILEDAHKYNNEKRKRRRKKQSK